MKLTQLFENSSMYIPTRLTSSTLISLVIGLSILGLGCGSSSGNTTPLNVAGTWTGTYNQTGTSGSSVHTISVPFTLTVTQTGDSVDYDATINGGYSNGVHWVCQNGTISGTTITFPSCTVTNPSYPTCTANVTNRKDVINDKVTPWTMSPSYSYTWETVAGSSSACSLAGDTVTVPTAGGTATLSKQ